MIFCYRYFLLGISEDTGPNFISRPCLTRQCSQSRLYTGHKHSITLPADVLSPNGARPSAQTVMITKVHIVFFSLFCLPVDDFKSPVLTKRFHSKWPTKYHDVPQNFQFKIDSFFMHTNNNIQFMAQIASPIIYKTYISNKTTFINIHTNDSASNQNIDFENPNQK